jgi:hypothetical protein
MTQQQFNHRADLIVAFISGATFTLMLSMLLSEAAS